MFIKAKNKLINLNYVVRIDLPCLTKQGKWVVLVEYDERRSGSREEWIEFNSKLEAQEFIEIALTR